MRRQPETAGAAFVCTVQLPDPGTRRNSEHGVNLAVRAGEPFGSHRAEIGAVSTGFQRLTSAGAVARQFFESEHIGNASDNPKEGITVRKLTTRVMIATASLVVAAGVASAQTMMNAEIPFEFRAGNRVMEAGTYRVDNVSPRTGSPIFRLLNMNSGGSIVVLPQAPAEPQKGWQAEGNPKLAFACTSGSCVLAEVWAGSGSQAYTFQGPNLGKDVTAYLRVIPMQRDKGE